MVERGPGELRYKAFLSYSHRDAAAAARLHRRLETYRMPRRLVGSAGARGPVPERLWPIFRDRDELPAATDLSETVREALAQSGSLIILCSPHAARSLWVAEEIETFRRLYPERPILAAIVEGDPPGCFPAALRAFGRDGTWHEPLATDLRPQGDGPHLGLLKLVAGITGVGLDALVQRDASRRIRRVTAVTAGALVAMLMMAVLTLVALNARSEAERQRAQAEGLIEFMLTDLRERLRGVGRLDVMTAVNRRALAYYGGQQELGGLGPQSLERRARVLHAMGEDDSTRGNLDAALVAFREAHRTTAEQLARSPDDPERIFAHSQSEYWLGSIDQQRGNYRGALAAYERYRDQAQRMSRLAPDNPRYLGELAYAESNLGSVNLHGLERPQVARQHFQRALGWFQRVAALEPANTDWVVEVADAHAWISDTWFAQQRYVEARAGRLEEQRIKRRLLAREPDNRAHLYATTIPMRSLARIDIELREFDRALALLGRARSTLAGLLALDPENLVWRDQATMVELDHAKLFIAARRPGEARIALAAARTLLEGAARTRSVPSGDRAYLYVRLRELSAQTESTAAHSN